MTDDELETTGGKVIDPREYDLDLDDQDVEDIRDFVERAESGRLGPVDPGLEAMVKVARLILEEQKDQGERQ